MTPHRKTVEVGVRELHDKLSHYLDAVVDGDEVIVTKRGRRIARLASIDAREPMQDLIDRGLIRPPLRPKQPRLELPRIKARGGLVSDIVSEQRG